MKKGDESRDTPLIIAAARGYPNTVASDGGFTELNSRLYLTVCLPNHVEVESCCFS